MLKAAVILSLVFGSMVDGKAKNSSDKTHGPKKFPAQPGSVPVLSLNNRTTTTSTTSQTTTTITTTEMPTTKEQIIITEAETSIPDVTSTEFLLEELKVTTIVPMPVPFTNQDEDINSTLMSDPTTLRTTKSTVLNHNVTWSKGGECSSMFGCADCSTVQVCKPSAKGLVKAFTLTCPHTAPYCDFSSGTCTSALDTKCASLDYFICPEDGYFPDPTNCSVYHACNDFNPELFKCTKGQTYNPEIAECNTNTECDYTVNCTGHSEIKLKMGSTKFYAYCSSGLPIIITHCPGKYKLNETSQICEPICEEEGFIADVANCSKYYNCTNFYVSSNLSVPIRQDLSCQPNEAFELSIHQCIPKKQSSCKI